MGTVQRLPLGERAYICPGIPESREEGEGRGILQ